ncbi:MAG: hypothetical protein IT365_21765 [Candidatus Hydrogenedentes bacterium]|nr:hypothetical protein [Candidatus Hydrogenedentota bacterium]
MDTAPFPEYGDGGDFIGARRMRRAFRWCIALVVFFTIMLWFSEHFLRFDHAERLYLSALTKAPESGRNLLRQAVLHDRENNEYPSPKYVEALAEREEEDLILPTYDQAYRLDLDNPFLALRYGCRLFHDGQVTSARQRFRDAADLDPKNLLPVYLEASVIPWLDETNEDLEPAMGLIARANNAPGKVQFPRPLWSPALPDSGYLYALLRRQIVEQCSEPLFRFTSLAIARAEMAITENKIERWPEHLNSLKSMGLNILKGSLDDEGGAPDRVGGGSAQAYLALAICAKVVEQQQRLAEKAGNGPDEKLAQNETALEEALNQLVAFEAKRQDTIAAERDKFSLPLRLGFGTLGALILTYGIVYIICKICRVSSTSHNVAHKRLGRLAFGLWTGTLLGLLLLISLAQGASVGAMRGETVLSGLWWLSVGGFTILGIVYPRISLPRPSEVVGARPSGLDSGTLERDAQKSYRLAYLSLLRRYMGVMFGLALLSLCVWTVAYRISSGVYPWEVELLATALESEEIALVRQIVSSFI